jgi:DNA-binding Lrp family transcriptional regulator
MISLDATDRALIAALRVDARVPATSLASRLGLSRATVKSRIERLRESGVIQGFTVLLATGTEAAPVRAVSLVAVSGAASDRVARRLYGLASVRSIYSTSGRWDLVVELEVASLEAFDAALRELRAIEGVANSETSLLLARCTP